MKPSGRILGIDFGTRRIGISISDPLGIIARPLEVLENRPGFIERLKKIVRENEVRAIVVGMPYNLKGETGEKAREVEQFIEKIRTAIDVPVETCDERFTSSIAQETMLEMGLKKKARREKGRIDQMAAAIILQSYLDSQK